MISSAAVTERVLTASKISFGILPIHSDGAAASSPLGSVLPTITDISPDEAIDNEFEKDVAVDEDKEEEERKQRRRRRRRLAFWLCFGFLIAGVIATAVAVPVCLIKGICPPRPSGPVQPGVAAYAWPKHSSKSVA